MITLEKILGALTGKENLYRCGRNFTAIEEALNNVGGGTAADTSYDNTESGMLATDVQAAVDELRAQNNSLDYYLKQIGKYGIKNSVKNGDFAEGTTGWNTSANVIADTALVPHSFKHIPNGTIAFGYKDVPCLLTDKLYICGKVYLVDLTANIDFFSIRNYGTTTNATPVYPDITKLNQWQKISVISSGKTSQGIRLYVGNSNVPTVGTYYSDDIIIINLTSLFGVGNEPTKEIMDAIIDYYPNMLKFYDISELSNKVDKAQPNWIAATLQNGWTGNLWYRKNSLGLLEIGGAINPGTLTAGTIIAQLPVGYRPYFNKPIPCINANTGATARGIFVNTSGNVIIYMSEIVTETGYSFSEIMPTA